MKNHTGHTPLSKSHRRLTVTQNPSGGGKLGKGVQGVPVGSPNSMRQLRTEVKGATAWIPLLSSAPSPETMKGYPMAHGSHRACSERRVAQSQAFRFSATALTEGKLFLCPRTSEDCLEPSPGELSRGPRKLVFIIASQCPAKVVCQTPSKQHTAHDGGDLLHPLQRSISEKPGSVSKHW